MTDDALEAAEIDLAKGTLADALIDARTVALLGVDGIVLGGDAYALALDAEGHGGTNLTRHEGVF